MYSRTLLVFFSDDKSREKLLDSFHLVALVSKALDAALPDDGVLYSAKNDAIFRGKIGCWLPLQLKRIPSNLEITFDGIQLSVETSASKTKSIAFVHDPIQFFLERSDIFVNLLRANGLVREFRSESFDFSFQFCLASHSAIPFRVVSKAIQLLLFKLFSCGFLAK